MKYVSYVINTTCGNATTIYVITFLEKCIS